MDKTRERYADWAGVLLAKEWLKVSDEVKELPEKEGGAKIQEHVVETLCNYSLGVNKKEGFIEPYSLIMAMRFCTPEKYVNSTLSKLVDQAIKENAGTPEGYLLDAFRVAKQASLEYDENTSDIDGMFGHLMTRNRAAAKYKSELRKAESALPGFKLKHEKEAEDAKEEMCKADEALKNGGIGRERVAEINGAFNSAIQACSLEWENSRSFTHKMIGAVIERTVYPESIYSTSLDLYPEKVKARVSGADSQGVVGITKALNGLRFETNYSARPDLALIIQSAGKTICDAVDLIVEDGEAVASSLGNTPTESEM